MVTSNAKMWARVTWDTLQFAHKVGSPCILNLIDIECSLLPKTQTQETPQRPGSPVSRSSYGEETCCELQKTMIEQ
ncbi:hypothetical protein TNCV_216801 [Trichonephila clavipes]|nr:hypothetical protein TNCV_216801 [Trichonephila clavipes]